VGGPKQEEAAVQRRAWHTEAAPTGDSDAHRMAVRSGGAPTVVAAQRSLAAGPGRLQESQAAAFFQPEPNRTPPLSPMQFHKQAPRFLSICML